MDRLVESLQSGVTEEHKNATIAVSEIVGDRFTDLVGSLLERVEDYAKAGAIILLRNIGTTRSWELLTWSFKNKALVSVSIEALVTGGLPAVTPLINSFERYPDDVCYAVAGALSRIGSVAVEPLISALQSGHSRVRFFAAVALGQISSAKAVKPLLLALRDADTNVRSSAAQALGKMGEPAVGPLMAAVSQEDDLMLDWVIRALSYIGQPAVPALLSKWWETYTQSLVLAGGSAILQQVLSFKTPVGSRNIAELLSPRFGQLAHLLS